MHWGFDCYDESKSMLGIDSWYLSRPITYNLVIVWYLCPEAIDTELKALLKLLLSEPYSLQLLINQPNKGQNIFPEPSFLHSRIKQIRVLFAFFQCNDIINNPPFTLDNLLPHSNKDDMLIRYHESSPTHQFTNPQFTNQYNELPVHQP